MRIQIITYGYHLPLCFPIFIKTIAIINNKKPALPHDSIANLTVLRFQLPFPLKIYIINYKSLWKNLSYISKHF